MSREMSGPLMQHYAALLYAALKPDPFYATLEAACTDRKDARAAMLDYYGVSLRDAANWGRVGQSDNGDFGVSIWSLPLDPQNAAARKSAKQEGLKRALGQRGLDCFNEIEAAMAVHENQLGLEQHWYLSILGVDPAHQGKGLGRTLLEEVLRDADKIGVSSYLTTFTPRNISFYRRLGYEDIGAFPEPVTGSAFHVLVRAPSTG